MTVYSTQKTIAIEHSGGVPDARRNEHRGTPPEAFFASLGNTYEITQPPPSNLNNFKHIEKWALKSAARVILPAERVAKCLRMVIATTVDIWRHLENQRAHFKGLAVCGSVWVCPVCASKITERRRVELSAAVIRAKEIELIPVMVTWTVPHHAGESLKSLRSKSSKARGLMKNRKQWKSLAEKVGIAGTICASEVTHGANGWHPHQHEILFLRSNTICAADLLPMWQKACLDAGLECPDDHGVDVKTGNEEVGNYISKWGMDAELTKSMQKKGRNGNRSPWDFLRDYLNGGDESDADLFREYSRAFKFKRQLVWSDGLRDLLGLSTERTDHELAEEIENGSVLLGALSIAQWRTILKFNQEGIILHLAMSGMDVVNSYIDSLEGDERN